MKPNLANSLKNFAKENNIDVPLVVGGYVRDTIFGLYNNIVDIDLTTNNSDITRYAIGFALKNNFYYKIFNDLHVTIYTDQYKNLDFSSNFNSKKAIDFYKNSKFSDKKYYEVISRDFTINTLHKSMFNDTILDPLEMGLKHCDQKVIKAVSTPDICFGDDPRRAYRAVSIAAKLNLNIDGKIIDFIKNNHSIFMPINGGSISETYITSNIDKVIGINDEVLLNLLIDTKLLPFIPMVGKFKDLLISKNMITIYLDLAK
jgi:tRNA nucleotidyltransferase/poly(A) polymerase